MISDEQKIEELVNAMGISKNFLSKSLGYRSHRTIYAIADGSNSLSEGMIDRIIRKFPRVNYNFMKKGELPVLLDDVSTKNQMLTMNIVPETDEFEAIIKLMRIPEQLDRIERKLDKLLGNE